MSCVVAFILIYALVTIQMAASVTGAVNFNGGSGGSFGGGRLASSGVLGQGLPQSLALALLASAAQHGGDGGTGGGLGQQLDGMGGGQGGTDANAIAALTALGALASAGGAGEGGDQHNGGMQQVF